MTKNMDPFRMKNKKACMRLVTEAID